MLFSGKGEKKKSGGWGGGEGISGTNQRYQKASTPLVKEDDARDGYQ